MLVLSRRTGETLFIGDDIKVTIVEVLGDKIKIGIDAPKSLTVLREELYQTVSVNKQATSTVDADALRALMRNFKKPQPPL